MALRIFGVALIVGEKGVALKVGEIAPQFLPLCTRLTSISIYFNKDTNERTVKP